MAWMPALPLRLACWRAALAAGPCRACGAPTGEPCLLQAWERGAWLHLARHRDWILVARAVASGPAIASRATPPR